MRHLYLLAILFLNCCNQADNYAAEAEKTDTIPVRKINNQPDSLDVDFGNYISTNFSKVIEEKTSIPVRIIDTILREYSQNQFTRASLKIVERRLMAKGFELRNDSTYFQKRGFNTRLFVNIEHREDKSILITYGMDLWESGKKYRNINWLLRKL